MTGIAGCCTSPTRREAPGEYSTCRSAGRWSPPCDGRAGPVANDEVKPELAIAIQLCSSVLLDRQHGWDDAVYYWSLWACTAAYWLGRREEDQEVREWLEMMRACTDEFANLTD